MPPEKLGYVLLTKSYLCIKVVILSPVKSVCKSPSGPDHTNVLCKVVGEDANVLPTNSDDQGPENYKII